MIRVPVREVQSPPGSQHSFGSTVNPGLDFQRMSSNTVVHIFALHHPWTAAAAQRQSPLAHDTLAGARDVS
eukprot:938092-Alexandrium_andersonii.AAC.1